MPSILFVCTGNIHRSPMAAAIFRNLIEERGLKDQWSVDSAGTWAEDGIPVPEEVKIVLNEIGVPMYAHSSKQITEELLKKSDLVLVMEENHKEALCFEYPDVIDKIYLLSEMSGKVMDVEDPIGGTLDDFRNAAKVIHDYIRNGFNKIQERTLSKSTWDPDGVG